VTGQLGDLNGDGVVDVRDLVMLQNHLNGVATLSSNALPLADLNDDGYVTSADVDLLANLILGQPLTIIPRPVTLDPASGATQVGVTVRPKALFPKPIDTSTLNSNNFYASFAGQRLPATIVPSSDGTWAWLFFNPAMPNAAQVQVTVDGSTIRTRLGLPVDAAGAGVSGSMAAFNFSTVSVAPLINTWVVGRIVDPGPDLVPRTADDYIPDPGGNPALGFYLLPIRGVKVYILGLETNIVYTDANGIFSLNPAPVGDVKVVVDGRTATSPPAGYYFPEMVMDTTCQPGAMNHVMSDNDTLFLPRVASNILQTVSASSNTLVTLSSNAAYTLSPTQQQYLAITVPSNSLVGMNGQPMSSGQVGISVVPPELVKDMLPPGVLQHTFDITVQAPGVATFTQPAQMTFPNVFGTNAPPGTKLSFLSFDHTTGRLVIEGTATVSANGLYVTTDPGTGVTHPGWHGLAPPGQPWSPPPPPNNPPAPYPPTGCPPFDDCAKQKYLDLIKCLNVPENGWDLLLQVYCGDAFLGQISDPYTRFLVKEACELKDRIDQANCYCQYGVGLIECYPQKLLCIPVPAPAPVNLPLLYAELAALAVQIAQLLQELPVVPVPLLQNPASHNHFQTNTYSPLDINYTVVAQITNLVAQANSLVGGDAVQYMQEWFLEKQTNLAVLGDLSGNAPAYPIQYCATIMDSSGVFQIRGKTAGFGQYSIFVGSDEQILDVTFYDPFQKAYGVVLPNFSPLAPYGLPRLYLAPIDASYVDTDGDGLPDVAEYVYGSDPTKKSTCGDGISDGERVAQGLDFSHCGVLPSGIIASLPLVGQATDITITGSTNGSGQQTAYVACGTGGLSIVNGSQFQAPILLSQLNLPGTATGVAVDGSLQIAVVAANTGGLHFVDVSTPLQPRLILTISTNASLVSVVAGVVYAAVGNTLQAYDLLTGQFLQTLTLGSASITGLANEGLFLYTMDTANNLRVIDISGDIMVSRGSLTLSAGGGKLFVGNGIAYVAAANYIYGGFLTVNVSSPDLPALLANSSVTSSSASPGPNVTVNGSGLGLVTVAGGLGVGPGLYVYNVSNPTNTGAFVTRYSLPAQPYGVAIGAGIGFAADGTAGLQVINYKSLDTFGIPPTITLSNSFTMTTPTNGIATEGSLVRVHAVTTDDVQVRNVEFYEDGSLVSSDQSFPFEYLFVTPALSTNKTNFTLQARAFDTGGNATWTPLINVQLAPDLSPPRLRRSYPAVSNVVDTVNATNIYAYFNKPINGSTLNSTTFTLIFAGPDHRLGTADDSIVTNGVVSYLSNPNAGALTFSQPLAQGLYRAIISTNLTDAAGNALTNAISWTFWVLAGGPDGDADHDDLSNAQEVALGTDPLNPDTDGDGWPDGVEVADGKDPLDPHSHPQMMIVAQPPVQIVLPGPDETGGPGAGTLVANPPVEVVLPGQDESGAPGAGTLVAQPPVEVILPGIDETGVLGTGTFVAQPAAEIVLPGVDETGAPGAGTTVAYPPLEIILPGVDETGTPGAGTLVAHPPLELVLPGADETGAPGAGTFLALPPLTIQFSTNQGSILLLNPKASKPPATSQAAVAIPGSPQSLTKTLKMTYKP
jgi:hypothetical protein